MRHQFQPREVVAGGLALAFLGGFILMFAWLLLEVWTNPTGLPAWVQTDTFTNVSTSVVGLVGGISAARMGARAARGHRFRTDFEWVYVSVYFILGIAAMVTLVTRSAAGTGYYLPEAIKNLGTVSFGLAIATVASYMGG